MKILVTGSTKLAGAIIKRFNADSCRVDSDIDYYQYDVFINNAHVGFDQCYLLDEWFNAWRYDKSKLIINISSRAAFSNLSKGYLYGAQKAALDHMADNLTYNSDKICRMTTLNLGLLEDDRPCLTYDEVLDTIQYILDLPQHIEIPRLVIQHCHNYQDVQKQKAARYG